MPLAARGRTKVNAWPRANGANKADGSAILYRILGNDLPPRHSSSQTIQNLSFILEHEPKYELLSRRWIVNRIMDSYAEQQILHILDHAREEYIRIPFILNEYAKLAPDFSHFEKADLQVLLSDSAPDGYKRILAHDHAFHEQNRYIMNVNGARNAAIDDGRRRAHWVFPWD